MARSRNEPSSHKLYNLWVKETFLLGSSCHSCIISRSSQSSHSSHGPHSPHIELGGPVSVHHEILPRKHISWFASLQQASHARCHWIGVSSVRSPETSRELKISMQIHLDTFTRSTKNIAKAYKSNNIILYAETWKSNQITTPNLMIKHTLRFQHFNTFYLVKFSFIYQLKKVGYQGHWTTMFPVSKLHWIHNHCSSTVEL